MRATFSFAGLAIGIGMKLVPRDTSRTLALNSLQDAVQELQSFQSICTLVSPPKKQYDDGNPDFFVGLFLCCHPMLRRFRASPA